MALETAFLTSGLPAEARLSTAESMARAVRDHGAEPAFVGLLAGEPVVGIDERGLEQLAESGGKLSTRDLPVAMVRGGNGGTTVAATLFLAHRAGISEDQTVDVLAQVVPRVVNGLTPNGRVPSDDELGRLAAQFGA